MKIFYICLLFNVVGLGFVFSQDHLDINNQFPEEDYENIHVKKLYGDSLSTGFLIWVKDTVKTHLHNWHSESIVVLEGEATMYLGDEVMKIQPGETLFIPKKTWHAVKVTSSTPLKVLSIQSPGFYGDDREFIHEQGK